jgi:hypothetical protein
MVDKKLFWMLLLQREQRCSCDERNIALAMSAALLLP